MAEAAVQAGRISDSDADELDQTDLIAAGVNDENRTVYAVAEISLTIHSEDIDRAAMRAGILAQAANAPAKAVCIGAGMSEQTAEYAAARNIIAVIMPEYPPATAVPFRALPRRAGAAPSNNAIMATHPNGESPP